MAMPASAGNETAYVDLYWIPLGAGGMRAVRLSGRIYEAAVARWQHRDALDLYHSALQVGFGGDRFTIEMTPVWINDVPGRGVMAEGPVWSRWLGRSRMFRYEVRRWRNGIIPDIGYAVASPQRLSSDVTHAGRLLNLVADFPTHTWGRDELHVGDMWNSNSLSSWLLIRSGHCLDTVRPPMPGWAAGLVAATRQTDTCLRTDALGLSGATERLSRVERSSPTHR